MPRELKWWVFREKREVYSRYVDVTKCMYNGVAIYGTIRGIVYWVRHHLSSITKRLHQGGKDLLQALISFILIMDENLLTIHKKRYLGACCLLKILYKLMR